MKKFTEILKEVNKTKHIKQLKKWKKNQKNFKTHT